MRSIPDFPLWIGNARDGENLESVHAHGIRAIVQLAREEVPVRSTRDLLLLRFPLQDGVNDEPDLLRLAITSVATLIALRIPTLLVCSAGMSRSPCVLAAALSLVDGRPPDTCLNRISENGPSDASAALWNDVLRITADLRWVDPTAAPADERS